ncbi:RedV protein [Streptomyces sp. NPDC017941]|uniref:RedV protein n=1 Tax=Streptomyces sp. NPDC017941 TaxID=3365018 RepID=UPI0037B13406
MTTHRAPRPATAPAETVRFADALDTAARIAVLSPSSHNCQPWALAWARGAESRAAAARLLEEAGGAPPAGGEGADGTCQYLVLGLDRDRALRALPAHAVEMLLSCGLYGQFLLRALDAQGWTADALRFAAGPAEGEPAPGLPLPGTDWPRTWAALCVVRLRPATGTAERDGELAALRTAAGARRTNRAPYRTHPVGPALLDGLATPSGLGAARGADVAVRHLSSDADRAAFADLVARYGGRDFSHRAAWRETHAYLRPTRAAATARGDGFALDQLFGPLPWPRRQALRVALAPATMRLLSHARYDRLLARGLAQVVRPTPALVVMSFTGSEPNAEGAPAPERAPTAEDAVRGGMRLADYWLCATRAGLALHPVSVVLQHEDVRAAFQSRLDIPGRAFFVSRLGWPTTEFPRSPRRSAGTPIRAI